MSEAVLPYPKVTRVPRLAGYGALAGLAGGSAMALWQMIDSGATSMGFWTPLNVCMASFVWRGQAAMLEREMMMHPGMSMDNAGAGGPPGRRDVAPWRSRRWWGWYSSCFCSGCGGPG